MASEIISEAIFLWRIYMARSKCEYCMYYDYDEELDYYVCDMLLDEDELYKFMSDTFNDCPYYRMGDDYTIARKQ